MLYKHVLLKASGEALNGTKKQFPWDDEVIEEVAKEVSVAHEKGIEVAVLTGGGNIWRGANKKMSRVKSDHVGLLATVMNGLAFSDALERMHGIEARVMTGIRMDEIAEPYLVHKARHHLTRRRVVILVGGTGHGFCTTDYAAALRASELECDLLAMGKNVNGVYDKDPAKHSDAKLLSQASYDRCLREDLQVMDTEAFARCRNGNLPIRVFSLLEKGSISSVLCGGIEGSLVSSLPDAA